MDTVWMAYFLGPCFANSRHIKTSFCHLCIFLNRSQLWKGAHKPLSCFLYRSPPFDFVFRHKMENSCILSRRLTECRKDLVDKHHQKHDRADDGWFSWFHFKSSPLVLFLIFTLLNTNDLYRPPILWIHWKHGRWWLTVSGCHKRKKHFTVRCRCKKVRRHRRHRDTLFD